MEDIIIHCVQCGTPFPFTVGEQKRFRALGFDTPKRCLECRKKKFKNLERNDRRPNKAKKKQIWRSKEL